VRIDAGQISDLIGVLDGLRADFALVPLAGEPSCREDLHPFNPLAKCGFEKPLSMHRKLLSRRQFCPAIRIPLTASGSPAYSRLLDYLLSLPLSSGFLQARIL
jgi:hypothetical protein